MRVSVRPALLVLLAVLGACAPATVEEAAATVRVVPGGWIEDRWVHLDGEVFALPAPPLDADASTSGLDVIYPYVWQRYGADGEPLARVDLPARARWIHARPLPVVGLENGLYTEAGGLRGYPAKDAALTEDGLYWSDGEALWRERERLLDGAFERVLVVADRVLALERDRGVYWPGEQEIELPTDWFAADAAADLYLLTPTGVVWLDAEGYELATYPGRFEQIAVDATRGVWLLDDTGNVRHLTLELEETW